MHVRPFRSPTLPPATTTNAAIIGEEAQWLVDPAATTADERERLCAWASGHPQLRGIAQTHHHRDHVGAASWLAARLGLPVAAHASTVALAADPDLRVSRTLTEGDLLCDDWVVLHTPGHASDHLCFVQRDSGTAVVGDMVAAVGTIVVNPPDGHMGTYLAQLQRLHDLDLRVVVPAHGQLIENPSEHFAMYLAHRRAREGLVAGALSLQSQSLSTIARRSYPDLDPRLLRLAERACLAHLEHLLEQGLAQWSPTSAPSRAERPWLSPTAMWQRAP